MTDDTPDSLRIALLGTGRMGREIAAIARDRGHRIVLAVGGGGIGPPADYALRRLSRPRALVESGADVAIDASVAEAVPGHVDHCAHAGIPVVIATTGWDARRSEVEARARDAGIGLLFAPNFSLGVNLFLRILSDALRTLEGPNRVAGYDVALHEAHHRYKVDHPSGTALRIAREILSSFDGKEEWSHQLPSGRAVDPRTLQISVTRSGEIPGTHVVTFEGPDDRIELRHEARSRRGFAAGAVTGAEWIRHRRGVFSMQDLLEALQSDSQRDDP